MLVTALCIAGLSMVFGSTNPKGGFLVNKLSRLNEAVGTKASVGTVYLPKRPAVKLGMIIL